jgi:uncharacterized protein YerC
MRSPTLFYLRIVKLLRKGRKVHEVAKQTGASYMYVWKIKRELKQQGLL